MTRTEKRRLRAHWREQIQILARGRCELCGLAHPDLDPHHIIPRREFEGGEAASYCDFNLVGLCPGCHEEAEKGEAGKLPAHRLYRAIINRGLAEVRRESALALLLEPDTARDLALTPSIHPHPLVVPEHEHNPRRK